MSESGEELATSEAAWVPPFGRVARYCQDTTVLIHLHMVSVSRLVEIPDFLVQAFYEPEDSKWLLSARSQAALAKEEVDSGFPLMHAHALLGLWSALEALIEDLTVAWLIAKPNILQRPAFSKIRAPVADFLQLSEEDRMSYVVTELQRDLKAELRQGVKRFETVLDAIGMGGVVSPQLGKALYEAQQVRNALAHRGGMADRRLIEACPWLDLTAGQPLTVTHAKFEYYTDAVCTYLRDLINRWRAADGLDDLKAIYLPSQDCPYIGKPDDVSDQATTTA